MKHIILYPADYFNLRQIDMDYESEYKQAIKFPEYQAVFYNHDEFISGEKLKIYPTGAEGLCIGRTWMFKPEQYIRFYNELESRNKVLINSPDDYNNLHIFTNVYAKIKDFTPKAISFENYNNVDAQLINREFKEFMIKDYVKSVKGADFPISIKTPVTQEYMESLVKRFVELRENLFTGGIVIKDYVQLKKYGSTTNEYRAFYLKNKLISLSRNSNQPENCSYPNVNFVNKFNDLSSNYYTVDFAELADGSFTVLETGDGQVSGLSPNQYIFKYYEEMNIILRVF